MPVQTRFHIRRKIFVFTVCLIVSTVLWLLNDLTKVQSTSVEIPIRFIGMPYDMVTTNSLPSSVEATIEATGFALLWRHFTSEKKVVEIPLRINQSNLQPGKTYQLNFNYYMNELSKALGFNIKIKRLFPDTFSLKFEKKFIKKVPVKLMADIEYEKEFYPSGKIKVEPDSIIISGVKERIKDIKEVHTLTLQLKSQKKGYNGRLQLEELNGVTYNVNYVEVKFPVEQFTEKNILLQITPVNVPSNYELNTIPDKVTLKLLVPISVYNDIQISQFQVSAPFPGNQARTRKILLNVAKKPEFIQVIEIIPSSVEYRIKAKE